MKYKVVVKTTHKHVDRLLRCKKIWLYELDYVCLTDNIVDHIDMPQISGSSKDNHGESSEEKTVFMFNHIKNNIDLFKEYDWFIFIDDDAILNKKYLEFILPFLKSEYIYGLNMKGSYPEDKTLVFPSGGAGYIVSNDTIRGHDHIKNFRYLHEDVSVGRYMRDNNIILESSVVIGGIKHKIGFNGWNPFQKNIDVLSKEEKQKFNTDTTLIQKIIDESAIDVTNYISHHYIKNDLMMDYIKDKFDKWTPDIAFGKDSSMFSGFNTDKNTRHSYGDFYDNLFSVIPDGSNLIEFGVMYGGSCAAFKNRNHTLSISGVDKNPIIDKKYQTMFSIIKGNLFSEKTVNIIKSNTYKVIIDDMSHSISDMIMAFNIFCDNLEDDGIYIIEDLHEPEFMMTMFMRYANLDSYRVFSLDLRKNKNRFDDFILVILPKNSIWSESTTQFDLVPVHTL